MPRGFEAVCLRFRCSRIPSRAQNPSADPDMHSFANQVPSPRGPSALPEFVMRCLACVVQPRKHLGDRIIKRDLLGSHAPRSCVDVSCGIPLELGTSWSTVRGFWSARQWRSSGSTTARLLVVQNIVQPPSSVQPTNKQLLCHHLRLFDGCPWPVVAETSGLPNIIAVHEDSRACRNVQFWSGEDDEEHLLNSKCQDRSMQIKGH